jgi:hypothetical protein
MITVLKWVVGVVVLLLLLIVLVVAIAKDVWRHTRENGLSRISYPRPDRARTRGPLGHSGSDGDLGGPLQRLLA